MLGPLPREAAHPESSASPEFPELGDQRRVFRCVGRHCCRALAKIVAVGFGAVPIQAPLLGLGERRRAVIPEVFADASAEALGVVAARESRYGESAASRAVRQFQFDAARPLAFRRASHRDDRRACGIHHGHIGSSVGECERAQGYTPSFQEVGRRVAGAWLASTAAAGSLRAGASSNPIRSRNTSAALTWGGIVAARYAMPCSDRP